MLVLCSSIFPLFIAALPHNVELKTEFPFYAPVVDADEIQLHRALINLIMKAGESLLEEKGEVVLSNRTLPAVEIPPGDGAGRGFQQRQIEPEVGADPDPAGYFDIAIMLFSVH